MSGAVRQNRTCDIQVFPRKGGHVFVGNSIILINPLISNTCNGSLFSNAFTSVTGTRMASEHVQIVTNSWLEPCEIDSYRTKSKYT